MIDPLHVSMSETLQGIRFRAGYSKPWQLALTLEIEPERVERFERAGLSADQPGDQRLVDVYGELAVRKAGSP